MIRPSSNGEITCSSCDYVLSHPKVVVSRGSSLSRLMIIGEAPGVKEDSEGEPFVGRSGKLLDQLLLSVGINPEKDVFICNAVKCRPPKNRRPTKAELKCSLPWLYQQVHLVDPWVIVLAGSTAVEAILGMKHTMSTIRGSWQLWKQRLIMPIFHPSYLLRNPSKDFGKPFSLTRADLIDVRNKLETIKSQVPIPPISGIENLKS